MFRKLIIISIVLSRAVFGFGDVLWWLVDDTATVDGQDMYSFVLSYGVEQDETGYNWYNVGARVRMTNPDGSTSIVPIAYPDFPGDRYEYSEFYDGGGANGSGFGTGWWSTQSPLHEIPSYSSELLNEAEFMVELGYLTYDDVLDAFGWETIAKSETVFGSKIRGAIFAGGINVPADYQWTPTTYYTVPEPQVSILLLIGASILVLRRKI